MTPARRCATQNAAKETRQSAVARTGKVRRRREGEAAVTLGEATRRGPPGREGGRRRERIWWKPRGAAKVVDVAGGTGDSGKGL
ncbi:hypothetical protein Sgou_50090 [Streptomyces gougerotii]|uniref:Uncharacterized protein n=2 Tax=Streptomyces diastaticus group TaxID=2849069 RepID=A0A8H9HGS4_9ACTN|nr:hypothetical protein Srut_23660 [Streptomyces rutgersensis]GFH71103.1 hypothetical protein Sdia_18710 [Streptomyces diastaticus subsp. diastaticus]GFH80339.1 hypothetical protein Sgou_50090 [Streptomyces gougerotii]GGU31692.1 hypothetical protein GCM10015534_37900 [Streptomyces diastaticus subsp. diastaticus]GGU57670.1 hypothetical protein GCM10010227_08360 [Streptomyces gougerotii]